MMVDRLLLAAFLPYLHYYGDWLQVVCEGARITHQDSLYQGRTEAGDAVQGCAGTASSAFLECYNLEAETT